MGLYRTIKQNKLYEAIAKQIQDLIIADQLRPGDKFPPERELAKQLGVSRGVVREAIRVLEQKGLLKVKPGKGTFVDKATSDTVADSIELLFRVEGGTILELLEVRKILEIEIAGLAAKRVKEQDLQKMEITIQQMQDNLESAEEYIEADMMFHSALAEAAKNRLFPLIINPIVDLLRENRKVIFDVPGSPQRALRHHQIIYECIKARDSEKAKMAMQQHLLQVQEDIQSAIS